MVLALLALPAGAVADPGAVLAGTVVDDSGAVQAGVTVIAADQIIVTDDRGHFELELPVGVIRIELSAPWLRPLTVEETMLAGARRVVTYTTYPIRSSDPLANETVHIEDSAPIDPGRQRIDAGVARSVAGASGDVLKVVESLAGVARPSPGKAELVVWGAAPQDTQVLIDGVPIPSLYHVGGWRAAIGGELVTELVLEPGAFGPEYGRAIGGIIAVTTEVPAGDGMTVAADLLDVGASVHHALGDTRIAATGRWSYLDRIIAQASEQTGTEISGDAGDLVPVPQWGDGSVMMERPLGRGQARVFAIGSRDQLTRTVDSDDPAEIKRQRIDNDMMRLGASWRGPSTGGSARITGYLGRDRDDTALTFGAVPAALRSVGWLGGVRAEQVNAVSDAAVLTIGAEATLRRDNVRRNGSLGTPAREGDIAIFGQPPGDDVASDDWVATTTALAAYLAVDAVWRGWTVSPGMRLDGYVLGSSRLTPKIGKTPEIGSQRIEFEPQPRLSLRYQLGAAAVRIDGGMYSQPRQPRDVSAVFGSPRLGIEHARHLALGASYSYSAITVEVTGYLRTLDDLVARSPAATPPATGALTQDGTGTVIGGQLVAKLAPWHGFAGWLSYGLSRSQRRDAPGEATRRFDHDQTHLVTMVTGWQRGRWSLGTRLRLASGEPRTEVIAAFIDARTGRYQPILGGHNGVQLPIFAQLDVRAERRLPLRGGELAISVELQNVSSRRNAEEIVYSADYSDRGQLTGLPVLAVLGARWQR